MPTVRAKVNQQVQIGVETTPGTSVAANKLLIAFDWTTGLKPTTKQFRGTGRQYPSASAILTEESAGKISGPGDFAQLVYPLASLWGSGAPVLHAGATTAYDWIWTPGLTGSYAANAKTFTLQVGDASDAEQYAFLVFHGFDYSFGRKQEVQIGGEFMSQTFTEGVTLTASPTTVQQAPMTGAQFNVYLDTTSAGIGTTLLSDPLKVAFKASGYYGGYWPILRANSSFTNIVDMEKKHELTLTLQANSTGIAMKSGYLENGARAYVRVAGTGGLIENDWTVGVGAASAGTFTLTFGGQTTAGIAYNAAPSAVASAFTALTSVGAGNATVSGAAPTWTIKLTGALAQSAGVITGSGTGLTGGAFTATAAPIYGAMTHDMACFVSDMKEFSDVDGVYAVEYTLIVGEDSAWGTGTAQKMTLTNLVSAL